jgi:hypothetical protein
MPKETRVELSKAMEIANKMVKPWQWTTIILSGVIAVLSVIIILTDTDVDSSVEASKLTAESLVSSTVVSK